MKRYVLLVGALLLMLSACTSSETSTSSPDTNMPNVLIGLWRASSSTDGDVGFFYDFHDNGIWYVADSHGDIITEYQYTYEKGYVQAYDDEGDLIQYRVSYEGNKMTLNDSSDPYISFQFEKVTDNLH